MGLKNDMDKENKTSVKSFFSKEDIEFLKVINNNTRNLEEVLKSSSSSDDRENVSKKKK